MAESVVTLDTLFGPDPAAADNSGAHSAAPGATQGAAPHGAPAGSAPNAALQTKIEELERLVHRHREQLTGSQQEIERLRTEVTTLRAAPPAAPPSRVETSPPAPVSLTEATKKLLLDNDESDLKAFEAALTRPGGITKEEVLQLITERDSAQQRTQKQQADRAMLQQAIVRRHPELLGAQPEHQVFIQATAMRYQELKQDALANTLYPEDPQYNFEDPSTGIKYDMRVLMQAANEVKLRGTSAAGSGVSPTLGVTGGSAPAPRTTVPVVPKAMVEGENAVLRDPRVQAALASLGWGNTPREQVAKMLEHVDPTLQARWQRGEL